MRAPEEIAALPPGSLDVVVLHSVAQYLSPKELDELLVLFRRLLGADGVFILGDIIPPHVSALGDAAALLHFAARNGFLGAALVGLGRTFVSDYWRLRSNLGLTRYGEGGGDGEADPRGLLGAARAGEYRSQPGPHDLSGASRVRHAAARNVAPAPPRLTRP